MKTPLLSTASASNAASASQLPPIVPATTHASGDNFSAIMGRALASSGSENSEEDSTTSPENASSGNSESTAKSGEQDPAAALDLLATLVVPTILPPAPNTPAITAANGTDTITGLGDALPASQTQDAAESNSSAATDASANADQSKTVSIPTAALTAPGTRAEEAKAKTPVTWEEISISTLADSLRPLNLKQPTQTQTTSLEGQADTKTVPDFQISVPQTSNTEVTQESPASIQAAESADVAEQKLPVEVKTISPSLPEVASEKPASLQLNNVPLNADLKAETSGTSGAKYRSPMQKAEKVNDFTGLGEQKLPVTASATGASIAVKAVKMSGAENDLPKEASLAIGSSFSATDNMPSGIDSRVDQIFPNTAARAVERAHDMMALHAMRLRDSGRDSMQIVIKPSPDLHLSLNLQNRDGAIEVTAQLQRGDYEILNRHWADLQQQMEARGVRLAPLSNQNQSLGNNSSNASPQSRQNSEDKTTKNGAFAEFALSGVLVPKRTATKTTAPRGWESWA